MPECLRADWRELSKEHLALARQKGTAGGAILVFMPGAPEINRLARSIWEDESLIAAAGGEGRLRVLPLHGALSAGDQSKVFAR